MAAAVRDADIEYLSLAPIGDYRSSLLVLDLGPIRLLAAHDAAHITRGAIAPGRAGVLLPVGRATPGLRVNGLATWGDSVVLLRAGTELLCHAPERLDWVAIAFDEEHFGSLLDRRGTPARFGAVALGGLAPVLERVGREVPALGPGAWAGPPGGSPGAVARAVFEQLSACLSALLAPIPEGGRRPRQLGRHVRLVARAEEVLRAATGRGVYTHEVAGVLGVSERTLSEAFRAVYGIPVQRYLRMRRLNLARRALCARGCARPLIKTVALDLGFINLGRFAQEYRSLFGEHPSATAARTQGVPPGSLDSPALLVA